MSVCESRRKQIISANMLLNEIEYDAIKVVGVQYLNLRGGVKD